MFHNSAVEPVFFSTSPNRIQCKLVAQASYLAYDAFALIGMNDPIDYQKEKPVNSKTGCPVAEVTRYEVIDRNRRLENQTPHHQSRPYRK
jgi:hypothetical protein